MVHPLHWGQGNLCSGNPQTMPKSGQSPALRQREPGAELGTRGRRCVSPSPACWVVGRLRAEGGMPPLTLGLTNSGLCISLTSLAKPFSFAKNTHQVAARGIIREL